MNISDFNSLSHFTNRRSGSTKKSNSDSGKKIIRKRKNYERFLLNEKKLRSSIQKKLIPKLQKKELVRQKQIEGMKELQDVWKKVRIKKIKRDYNKTEQYDTTSRYKLNFDKNKKKKILLMIKAKLLELFIDRYKDGDAIEVFESKYLGRLPYNLSDRTKWLLVAKAAKELYSKDIDKMKLENERFSLSIPTYRGRTSSGVSVPGWVPRVVRGRVRKWLNNIKRPFDRLKDAALRGYNSALRRARSFARSARNAVNTLRNFPQQVINQAKNVFSSVTNSVRNTVRSVSSGISRSINGISNSIGNKLNSIKNTVGGIGRGISNTISKSVNSVKNVVGGITRGAKRAVQSVISSVGGVINKIKTSVSNAVSKTFNTVKSTLVSVGSKLLSSAKTIIKKIGGIAKKGFKFMKDAVSKVSTHMKKFVVKGWTWIKNTAKKAFGFFKRLLVKIWKWFKKTLTRLFGFLKALFGGKNLVAKIMRFLIKIVLVLLGGIPGQLIARMKYLNGSLDKWWLLLPPFTLYPISAAPTIMFVLNKIKKGVDDELPYDAFLRVVMLLGVTLPALENVFDTNYLFPIYSLYTLGSWFLIFSMRDKKKCKKVRGREDGWQLGKFLKSASLGSIAFVILRDLLDLFGGYIPLIGILFDLIGEVPLIGEMVINSLAAASAYILVNMLNNTPRAPAYPGPLRSIPRVKKAYCDDYPKKKGIHAAIRGFGFLTVYFLLNSTISTLKEYVGNLL